MRFMRGLATAVSALGAAGCTLVGGPGTLTTPSPGLASIDDPVPYSQPASASGNMVQYEQGGRTYRVLDTSYGYDERGVASWSRWLAGTRRVPPFRSVKSSSIQAMFATTGFGVQKPT